MSILEDLADEKSGRNTTAGPRCKVRREADRLEIPFADIQAVFEAVDNGEVGVMGAFRVLRKSQINLSYATVERHAKGNCSCPRRESTE